MDYFIVQPWHTDTYQARGTSQGWQLEAYAPTRHEAAQRLRLLELLQRQYASTPARVTLFEVYGSIEQLRAAA